MLFLSGLTDADILKAACTQAILAKYIQAVSSVGVMSAGLVSVNFKSVCQGRVNL